MRISTPSHCFDCDLDGVQTVDAPESPANATAEPVANTTAPATRSVTRTRTVKVPLALERIDRRGGGPLSADQMKVRHALVLDSHRLDRVLRLRLVLSASTGAGAGRLTRTR